MSAQELAHKLAMQYVELNGSDKTPEELVSMYDDAYAKIIDYIHSHPGANWTF